MTRTLCFFCFLLILALGLASTIPADAQVLTTFYSFPGGIYEDDFDGSGGLVQGSDGVFYGVSEANNLVFKITATGTYTVIHSFGSVANDGGAPGGALIQASDGSFYGTTEVGGLAGGIVFKITSAGNYTILHDFGDGTVLNDGTYPVAALVQGTDGNFYGTTLFGGHNDLGTVYKMTPAGAVTILHRFGDGSVSNDGASPECPLIQGSDGNFYGTTMAGGASGLGTAFKITPAGVMTILHSFGDGSVANDGAMPYDSLVQADDGNFYGTTYAGGSTVAADPMQLGYGTVFKMTPSGAITVIYNFSDGSVPNDGSGPSAALALGLDGYLYGSTINGGSFGDGIVFKMTLTGTISIIHNFSALDAHGINADGAEPHAAIVQAANSNLYGTPTAGGSTGGGTVFTLSTSGVLLTIISLSPSAALAGSPAFALTITGTNFTNNSTVTFAGTPVTVTARTATQLKVTVPASAIARLGAKTVTVTDPTNGTGSATFTVTFIPLTIISLDPESVPVGSPSFPLTITGTNFTANSTVTVGGTAVTVLSHSAAQLTVTVPASAITTLGAKTVVVSDSAHGSASAIFTVVLVWNVQDVAAVSDGTARLLWDRTDGAAGIWALSAGNTQTLAGPTYGPYQGWTAQDITAAADGTSRILWNRYDGATGVWAMDAHGNQTSVSPTYGPFSGWKAIDLAAAPNGTSRLMWRYTNGQAGLLSLNATGDQIISGRSYGPYTGWTATAVSAAGDGTARMLWTRSDGAMGLWTMDSQDLQKAVGPVYGPYSDSHGIWRATDLSTSSDGTSQVLWKRSDGAIGVWTFSASNTMTTVGAVYGPYAGFTAAALDAASDKARVLWVRSDRAAGLWSFGSNDLESLIGPVYGPY